MSEIRHHLPIQKCQKMSQIMAAKILTHLVLYLTCRMEIHVVELMNLIIFHLIGHIVDPLKIIGAK